MPLRILVDTNVLISAALFPETIDALDFPVLRDVADIPVLASAILADVDILITGDKDFSLVKMDRPLIFTPRQYLDLIPH